MERHSFRIISGGWNYGILRSVLTKSIYFSRFLFLHLWLFCQIYPYLEKLLEFIRIYNHFVVVRTTSCCFPFWPQPKLTLWVHLYYSLQFEKTNIKNFPCGLLFSHSRLLFKKESNDVNRDLANYGKSPGYSCKTYFLWLSITSVKKKRNTFLRNFIREF